MSLSSLYLHCESMIDWSIIMHWYKAMPNCVRSITYCGVVWKQDSAAPNTPHAIIPTYQTVYDRSHIVVPYGSMTMLHPRHPNAIIPTHTKLFPIENILSCRVEAGLCCTPDTPCNTKTCTIQATKRTLKNTSKHYTYVWWYLCNGVTPSRVPVYLHAYMSIHTPRPRARGNIFDRGTRQSSSTIDPVTDARRESLPSITCMKTQSITYEWFAFLTVRHQYKKGMQHHIPAI